MSNDEIITIRVMDDESCAIEFPNAKMASRARNITLMQDMTNAILAWRKDLMETPPHD